SLITCSVPAPTESSTLSLHDALPISTAAGNVETSQRIVDVLLAAFAQAMPEKVPAASQGTMNNLLIGSANPPFNYYETLGGGERSEEHTSELQSRENLVCRLLLEKKK